MLARLSDRARQEGIRRFTALVAAENVPVARLLGSMCARLTGRESNTLEYEIALVHARRGRTADAVISALPPRELS